MHTVQITSNLTFTRACSQSPREFVWSTRVGTYAARKQKYYTHLYSVRTSELRVLRACGNIVSGSTTVEPLNYRHHGTMLNLPQY